MRVPQLWKSTVTWRVTKLENEMTPIQFRLNALDEKVDKLDTKMDKLIAWRREMRGWCKGIDGRFDKLEQLIRDTHSENGRNRSVDD